MAHPVFMIVFRVGQGLILQSKSGRHYTQPVQIRLFELLKFAQRRDAPAVLAKIEQRVVLLAVAITAVQTQRRTDAFLQLHHFFMSEAAQGEHPAAVAARDLRGDKIYARQRGVSK